MLQVLRKDLYLVIMGLVASAYITIFYDIFKHIFENYSKHMPIYDNTILIDVLAGILSIAIGIIVVFVLKRDEKKHDDKESEQPYSS